MTRLKIVIIELSQN